MDPTQCLKELREAITAIDQSGVMDASIVYEMVDKAKTKFDELDAWLSNGGFLPDDWKK